MLAADAASVAGAAGAAAGGCGGATPTAAAALGADAGATPTSVESTLRFTQNLHALEANLSALEHAGERLPDRMAARRAAGGGGTPLTSPFSLGGASPAVALTSPLGLANHQHSGAADVASMHKPGAPSPWVSPRRKRGGSAAVPSPMPAGATGTPNLS